MTGSTNTSLYTGEIDYQDIPSGFVSYWTLAIRNLTVNSNSVTLPSGQSSFAAIDTGTTLIGGPAAEVASVYAQIPNSVAGTGNFDGYYLYRALLTCFSCLTTCVLTKQYCSMLDDRQRRILFRRPILVRFTCRLQIDTSLGRPVCRFHFRVYRIQ